MVSIHIRVRIVPPVFIHFIVIMITVSASLDLLPIVSFISAFFCLFSFICHSAQSPALDPLQQAYTGMQHYTGEASELLKCNLNFVYSGE